VEIEIPAALARRRHLTGEAIAERTLLVPMFWNWKAQVARFDFPLRSIRGAFQEPEARARKHVEFPPGEDQKLVVRATWGY
jgi:hypothetical protein